MKSSRKHTFYPEKVIEAELKEIPRGKFSERVNELILKGLEAERQESIARAYRQYDSTLAAGTKREFQDSSVRFLSEGAFKPEDEVEEFV